MTEDIGFLGPSYPPTWELMVNGGADLRPFTFS